MLQSVVRPLQRLRSELGLSPMARAERRADLRVGLAADPGLDIAIEMAVRWLCRAQDRSRSGDGGVARHFSLLTGWSASYPETTGYIIPTMIAAATEFADDSLRARARLMLDWLLSIQFPDGGFQAGTMGAEPLVPAVFNTGQILLGLASGARVWGDQYGAPMRRAADWLVAAQDPDGCWRRFQSPFAMRGEKAYNAHVAWGLFETARVCPDAPYADAALANVRWTLGQMRPNGWFDNCCVDTPAAPLTHTIGYALRGLMEGFRFTNDTELLDHCRRAADGLLGALRPDGFLPGRLDARWRGAVDWACLTGSLQVAHCWLMLYEYTGEPRYRQAGTAVTRYVRRTMRVDGNPESRGGIKGSFPVSGDYGRFEYLAWACKFFVDANLLERSLRL